MKLTALAACASTALAFADTAAFFSSQQLDAENLKYITKSSDLSSAFKQFTSQFCLQSPLDKLTVYRVGHLSRKAPEAEGTFVKHVHYSSGSEIDLPVAEECSVVYMDNAPSDINEISANIIVVDVDDAQTHTVDEFLTGANVVVQGKPGFQTAGSRGESIKEFIGDKLNLDFEALGKRDADDFVDAAVSDKILEEVETDFGIAESLIAAQESDSTVHALSDDSALADYSGSGKNATTPNTRSNLFTNYQFFTPGVWSVLIVCFFLVYVSITAVGWITSIDLSYRSFDKQIEYEKKTE
ncbi:hypothetical protein JCM33374_g4286 [Metschnikowia sp. JCM 33374]|nr:hypothetical protein JCM33374_g4286 [Metschnikowia sp. JCM 33374]